MIFCGFLHGFFSNSELINNIVGTVIGGVILSLIIFLFNKYIIPKPNIVGEWIVLETIQKASRSILKDYKLEFKVHLLQKGAEIEGTGEKIKETSPQGEVVQYEVTKRVHIDIKGYIKRNYLGKSKISLLIYEEGRLRPSSATFELKIINSSTLVGKFISTAANASGEVVFKRNND